MNHMSDFHCKPSVFETMKKRQKKEVFEPVREVDQKLHLACRELSIAKIGAAIAEGADVNAPDRKHLAAPIDMVVAAAACGGRDQYFADLPRQAKVHKAIDLLLAHGAAPDGITEDDSPLKYFSWLYFDPYLVRRLCAAGAEVNSVHDGCTIYDLTGMESIFLESTGNEEYIWKLNQVVAVLEEFGAKSATPRPDPRDLDFEQRLACARNGDAEAQYWLGMDYESDEDYVKAVKWFRRAAAQGEARAQYELGTCSRLGQGVPQDYAEAVNWYRMAAEQGCAEAQCDLGVCYEQGLGVPKDFAEAVKWTRKAAEQDDVTAQANLGLYYDHGKGVPQDYAVAVKWYRKAAEQGDAHAQFNLGSFYDHGEGVAQDSSQAKHWYLKAAKQGHAQAQCNLGVCHAHDQQYDKAVFWFQKAAAQGDALAKCHLGDAHRLGLGVEKDIAIAAKFNREAATQGLANGQYEFGKCLERGLGVEPSREDALDWYRKAAAQGHAEAKTALARLGAT